MVDIQPANEMKKTFFLVWCAKCFEIVLQFIWYSNTTRCIFGCRFVHKCCTHLNQNAFECLAHRHAAKLDNEIAKLKTGPFRFNLQKTLFMCVVKCKNGNHENSNEYEKDLIRYTNMCLYIAWVFRHSMNFMFKRTHTHTHRRKVASSRWSGFDIKFRFIFVVNRNCSPVCVYHCLVCDPMKADQFYEPSSAFSTCMRAAFSIWANQTENRQPRGCASCPYPKWKTPTLDARSYVTDESISNCLPFANIIQKYENEREENKNSDTNQMRQYFI